MEEMRITERRKESKAVKIKGEERTRAHTYDGAGSRIKGHNACEKLTLDSKLYR